MDQMSTAGTAPLDRLSQLAGDPRRDTSTLGIELLDLHRELSFVHVARMDCGGISYSSDEYLAVASDARGAARLVAQSWLNVNGDAGLAKLGLLDQEDFDYDLVGDNQEMVAVSDENLDRVAAELNDYYGLHVDRLKVGGPVQVTR